ncbi:MAG: ABC-type sugar transport system, periplasmic component, partial [Eubacterium sp.]|nr:ABC-type sugar transport system, periplasmic component [Eubacterium sp.]
SQSKSSSASNGPVSIKIFMNREEYTEPVKAAITEYKRIKPNVTVKAETVEVDYPKELEKRIKAGDIPDVFTTSAGGEIKLYAENTADLTKQPLAQAMTDSAREAMSEEGKVYGIPLKLNAFGLIYNKEIFEKNKINAPKTISELTLACEKLKTAGIQPFTTGYKDWYVFKNTFMHFLNAAQPEDTKGLVEKFSKGKAKISDYPTINNNWFKFVDLTVQYGDKKPVETDLKAQIDAFATGKSAMVLGQGPSFETEAVNLNPKIKIGFTGYPTTENSTDALLAVGADRAVRINKASKVQKDALDLFNWLYTSEYGRKWFTDVAKVIPPVKDAPIPNMQIANEIKNYLSKNKPGDLSANYSLDTFHQTFGGIMQGYVLKTYTKEEAVKEIESGWQELGAAK